MKESFLNKYSESSQQGEFLALSKLLSFAENGGDISSIEKRGNESFVIGITGSPGVGKSSFVNRLTESFRNRNLTVGIIAVDPSSPFSLGAFLGDRIRMQKHSADPGVFIRSVGSRGSVGGLSEAVYDMVEVMRKFGFDRIIVETVGAGQAEIEVMYVADIILLALAPGLGDEVQAFKAGIMEIGDIYIINKFDLPDSQRLYSQLESLLQLEDRKENIWVKPIIGTDSLSGKGFEELVLQIEAFYHFAKKDLFKKREITRKKKRIETRILQKIRKIIAENDEQTALEAEKEIERVIETF